MTRPDNFHPDWYRGWRYWRLVGILRGLVLWCRVRYAGWRGGGTVRLGRGLYVWPSSIFNRTGAVGPTSDLTFYREPKGPEHGAAA